MFEGFTIVVNGQLHDRIKQRVPRGDEIGFRLACDIYTLTLERDALNFKPHTLRNTQATILLEAEVPLHVVAKRLGHKDALVTATIYAKVTAKQEDESSMVFGDWLQSGESTDEDTCAEVAR